MTETKTGILEELSARRRADAVACARETPFVAQLLQACATPEPPDFAAAFRGPGVRVIAELKRASPSEGLIRADFDPVALAQELATAGAAALSVLCEPHRFLGGEAYLRAAKAVVEIPVLYKDFVTTPYQVAAARAAGASAVLLIAAALDDAALRDLLRLCRTLGGVTNGASVRFLHDGAPVTPPFRPESPKLWSPEEPNLHLLTVEVIRDGQVVDAVGVRFGIRDFALDANGLTLNGRRYPKKLIGVNRHQDYLFIGMALPNSLHWRDAKKYRDCGMTVIRNAHYPQDPAFMDACDELGLFVVVNTPGWQFWNQDDPAFERRVYDDIVKMVRRDRARPSLLMWEPVLNETRYPAAFVTNAVRLVKRETRMPNYCACDGHAAGADVCDVRYWISVKGTVDAHRPSFCREWGDFPDDWNAQNSSSRVALEWGEGPMVAQADHYMNETAWPSLKTLCAAPPSLFGATLWHGADHARGYHPDNFFGGILSYGRQKKYAWHAFKAALTDEPYVFVAHEFAPYSPADITVYSNCAYTATWLGKPFDPAQTKFRYWEAQRLTYDGAHPERQRQAVLKVRLPDGSEIVKERARRFARIDLALDTEGLSPVADGSDLVALTATLADSAGTPRRYAREKIRFSAEGPAEIVGENPQETRWGEAVVLIRPQATATPRPITVRAELVRRGEYARQNGFLTFTPGLASVTTGHAAAGDARRLRAVEQQQKDFNVAD